MEDDFSKYKTMRHSGVSPENVYREAARDGLDTITRIRLIRSIYSLSPAQAKAVWVRAEGLAESLDEHQGKMVDTVLMIELCRAGATHHLAWSFGGLHPPYSRGPWRSWPMSRRNQVSKRNR